jgi:carboxypeptidase Taq
MQEKIQDLKNRLREIYDLDAASALLNWDLSTQMPKGGGDARARQMALLSRLSHERLTHPELAKLLDELSPYGESLDYASDDASLIRIARLQHEQAANIPTDLMSEFREASAKSYQAWSKARPENNFAAVLPFLEKQLDYSRRIAECFDYEHIADPLIGQYNHGLSTANVRKLFADLRTELVALLGKIRNAEQVDDSFLHQHFLKDLQYQFARQAITAFGYDWERGRMDETAHPFATRFSIGDVRITTRANDQHLGDGIFATMHESGHAMYEQGVNRSYEPTVLARGASAGVHESQSRLWENRVGRGKEFWNHYYPELQKIFPEQLKSVPVEAFYKAINKVQTGLIRVQADEVTYNLHIMLRSDLAIDMLEGSLAVKDLPEAWNARYTNDLGVTPSDDKDGVMQDVHWYFGMIGGSFEGYTLGNILGAQYYDTLLAQKPNIPQEISEGKFDTLFNWLKENIWQHGRKFNTLEITERITGESIRVEPLVNYLNAKFGEIYGL